MMRQELGVHHQDRFGCDRKASSKQFLLDNPKYAPMHFCSELAEAADCAGRDFSCEYHSGRCSLPSAAADFLIAGPPCSPYYSSQRAGKAACGWREALQTSLLKALTLLVSQRSGKLSLKEFQRSRNPRKSSEHASESHKGPGTLTSLLNTPLRAIKVPEPSQVF